MKENRYRVNYGNGTVSNTMSHADAERHLALQDGFAYIQYQAEPDEWVRARPKREPKTPTRGKRIIGGRLV